METWTPTLAFHIPQALIKFITSTMFVKKLIINRITIIRQLNISQSDSSTWKLGIYWLNYNSNQLLTAPLDKGTTPPITHTFIHVASHLHLLFLLQDIHAIHAKLMMLILIIILSLLKPRTSTLHTCWSLIHQFKHRVLSKSQIKPKWQKKSEIM